MKRKDFLKLSSASAFFLGLKPGKLDASTIEDHMILFLRILNIWVIIQLQNLKQLEWHLLE